MRSFNQLLTPIYTLFGTCAKVVVTLSCKQLSTPKSLNKTWRPLMGAREIGRSERICDRASASIPFPIRRFPYTAPLSVTRVEKASITQSRLRPSDRPFPRHHAPPLLRCMVPSHATRLLVIACVHSKVKMGRGASI